MITSVKRKRQFLLADPTICRREAGNPGSQQSVYFFTMRRHSRQCCISIQVIKFTKKLFLIAHTYQS